MQRKKSNTYRFSSDDTGSEMEIFLRYKEIESKVRKEKDIHYPATGLICLENAHSNGRVISLENMKRIYDISQKYNIPIHLDGARLFNASVHLGIDPKELTAFCDSVMFCLSKGLCAPVGSILAGSRSFISKARKGRKIMGGGMRQAGILAAAGLVALEKMRGRLKEDHDNAKLLAEELAKIPGISVNIDDVHINIVFIDISDTGYDSAKLVHELHKKGIKVNPGENGIMRFATHWWINRKDIYRVIDSIKDILAKKD
jgi:threonine aldolase